MCGPRFRVTANAMTFILQLADDPHFAYDASLLKSLHFMVTNDDLTSGPGRWRSGRRLRARASERRRLSTRDPTLWKFLG